MSNDLVDAGRIRFIIVKRAIPGRMPDLPRIPSG